MRRHDWPLHFERFARARLAIPFTWGANDCATFAAAGVEAITGVHLLPDLRGYTSAREALAAIRAAGGLDQVATRALGEPIRPLMAAVGDVVLVPMGKRMALGLCNGHTVIGAGRRGMAVTGMAGALKAWRVV